MVSFLILSLHCIYISFIRISPHSYNKINIDLHHKLFLYTFIYCRIHAGCNCSVEWDLMKYTMEANGETVDRLLCVCILGAVLKRGCRGVWDAFMFNAVIKKKAKVPASDSFVARRIAGPGLASNYFYQVCANCNGTFFTTLQIAVLENYLFIWKFKLYLLWLIRLPKLPSPFEYHWLGNLGNLSSNEEIHVQPYLSEK